MKSLVIAELEKDKDSVKLYPGTLNTIAAAAELDGEIEVLIAGLNIREIAKNCAQLKSVNKVLVADDAVYANRLCEDIAQLIVAAAGPELNNYTHILAPASTFGKALIPYAAALCDVQAISDITEIISPDTFVRPIYAGNALQRVKSTDKIKMLTVRTTAFDPAEIIADSKNDTPIVNIDPAAITDQIEFVGQRLSDNERPELTSARVVISGGRGMQSGDNFAMLEKLADTLGGAVGASRAAVDAGFVPNDYQVGQTGKIVAPDLYLAVGISGAIQHLAGMKDSKCIVAINNDEEAPIFQVADYSWCADLFTAVPALQTELDKSN